MSQLKQKIINEIIKTEGGYVNDPLDSGGETNFGITKYVARQYGYVDSMKDMPRNTAFEIYSSIYWDKLNLNNIENLSKIITKELADTSVNMGVSRAGEFLQRSLNVLNKNGSLYSDILVDGAVGGRTLSALDSFLRKRGKSGEKVLNRMLNSLQGAYYIALAERRSKDERFIFGWFSNRVS